MRVRAGTSGFAYKEWKGSFYPEAIPDADMLPYYAARLPAVEINNTFYRLPSEALLRGWAERAPGGFSFVLKASRRITHIKRLKDAGEPLGYLLATAGALGDRLGPFLFQLPPNLKKDLDRLEAFLALLPGSCRAAFEFRHPSWHDDDVAAALRARGAALVASDTDDDEADAAIVPTAPWGYLRLRRQGYDGAALDRWAERVRAQPWSEAWVFFKHEDAGAGPRLAGSFLARFGGA